MSMHPSETNAHLEKCEQRLLAAFVARNLTTLDELIHESALFVLPTGITITKAQVLENYRSGNTAMTDILPSDFKASVIGSTAVISVHLELIGKSNDGIVHSHFRYMRVWNLFDGAWRVVAVCGVPLQNQVPNQKN